MRKFTIVAAVLFANQASAQFAMDVTLSDIRKKAGLMAIEDLAIEEAGLVSYPRFCVAGGKLYLDRAATLESERSDYGITYRVQRKQGDRVVVEASAGARVKSLSEGLLSALRLALQMSCERADLSAERRLEVSLINGVESASKLIETLQ